MNILFITLIDIRSVDEHNIYMDLIREFIKHRHCVYVISPVERRHEMTTKLIEYESDAHQGNIHILKLKTGNIQKTNVVEKGISTLLLEWQLRYGIEKYFDKVHMDMVIYSTPPITIAKPIQYIKKRDNASTYLMLKDIFPQNAVDLGMLSVKGIPSILYKYFRRREKKLYSISDRIGCMSQANVNYIKRHNPEVDEKKLEVCPNCIEVKDFDFSNRDKLAVRKKYGIPIDKMVFVYGGNLGRPQGIKFAIRCLEQEKYNQGVFFLIIGDGTEYEVLEEYVSRSEQKNLKLLRRLPTEEYNMLVGACDVGLIFLDNRFTIPNFPSRILGYMQMKIPVLAVTDSNTDIGRVIVEGGFGWWCESNDEKNFQHIVDNISESGLPVMRDNAFKYLTDHYSSENAYSIIMRKNES